MHIHFMLIINILIYLSYLVLVDNTLLCVLFVRMDLHLLTILEYYLLSVLFVSHRNYLGSYFLIIIDLLLINFLLCLRISLIFPILLTLLTKLQGCYTYTFISFQMAHN